jgi:hypothetical protein
LINSRAAYGIIKHSFKKVDSYILQINPGWKNQYNFISGHIEPEDGNDYKKTMIREIEEELNPIKYKKEFEVKSISENPFLDEAYSLSAGEKTEYTFFIIQVLFLVPIQEISFLWKNDSSVNHWFTEEELRQGTGKRGEKIVSFRQVCVTGYGHWCYNLPSYLGGKSCQSQKVLKNRIWNQPSMLSKIGEVTVRKCAAFRIVYGKLQLSWHPSTQ